MVRYGPWSPDGKGARFTLPGAALHWPAAASVPLAAVAALALVVGGISLHRRLAVRDQAWLHQRCEST
jgi:hypothetical protein